MADGALIVAAAIAGTRQKQPAAWPKAAVKFWRNGRRPPARSGIYAIMDNEPAHTNGADISEQNASEVFILARDCFALYCAPHQTARRGPGFAGIKRDYVGFSSAFAGFSGRVLSDPLLTLVSG